MSDEDGHDHSLLERYQHHLLGLYRNPFLSTPARRPNAIVAILGIMLLGLMVWDLLKYLKYWAHLLLALLAIAAAWFASVALIGWLRPARPRTVRDRRKIAFETAKTPTQIRITINTSPEYERYFWSADDARLVEQWRRYHEEDVRPIRRNKAAQAAPAATPQLRATPLSPEAQKILAQITASPRLARHAWHLHETGLLEQWQRYQTHGQLPIRRSKLARQQARAADGNANGVARR